MLGTGIKPIKTIPKTSRRRRIPIHFAICFAIFILFFGCIFGACNNRDAASPTEPLKSKSEALTAPKEEASEVKTPEVDQMKPEQAGQGEELKQKIREAMEQKKREIEEAKKKEETQKE